MPEHYDAQSKMFVHHYVAGIIIYCWYAKRKESRAETQSQIISRRGSMASTSDTATTLRSRSHLPYQPSFSVEEMASPRTECVQSPRPLLPCQGVP